MIENQVDQITLEELGVFGAANKLLRSTNEQDVYIGFELCVHMPNYEIIKAYTMCNVLELSKEHEDWWVTEGYKIWRANFKNL